MNETPKPCRITMTLANGGVVRVLAHNTDPTKLVLKARSADDLDSLAIQVGVDLGGDLITGSHHTILSVDREKVATAVAEYVRQQIMAEPLSLQTDVPGEGSDDDGDDDNGGC